MFPLCLQCLSFCGIYNFYDVKHKSSITQKSFWYDWLCVVKDLIFWLRERCRLFVIATNILHQFDHQLDQIKFRRIEKNIWENHFFISFHFISIEKSIETRADHNITCFMVRIWIFHLLTEKSNIRLFLSTLKLM